MSTAETPSQNEAEAEAARADLVSTLSQLRENLKPANVVDEVMSRAKVNATAITDQIWDTAKRNPLPALMIGAGLAMLTGVGARMRFPGGRPASGPAKPDRYDAGHGRDPEFLAHVARAPRTGSMAGQASLSAKASSAVNTVAGRAGDVLDAANSRLHDLTSQGAAAVGTAYRNAKRSDSMSWSRRTLGSSINSLVEEQPLILAAVGVAIGAAIGAALPHTETEDSLMGETSGSVRTAAQGMVQDQVAQVKSAAAHAVEDIKQTVAEHGINADNLTGLVQDVGEKAKSATYEAGRAVAPGA